MLEGITVLNEYTKMTGNGGSCVLGGILLIIVFGAFLGLMIQDTIENKKATIGQIIGIIICLAFIVCAILLINGGVNWRETVYEVTISENVSPTQLLEQFEIRDKTGLIYKIVPYPVP